MAEPDDSSDADRPGNEQSFVDRSEFLVWILNSILKSASTIPQGGKAEVDMSRRTHSTEKSVGPESVRCRKRAQNGNKFERKPHSRASGNRWFNLRGLPKYNLKGIPISP